MSQSTKNIKVHVYNSPIETMNTDALASFIANIDSSLNNNYKNYDNIIILRDTSDYTQINSILNNGEQSYTYGSGIGSFNLKPTEYIIYMKKESSENGYNSSIGSYDSHSLLHHFWPYKNRQIVPARVNNQTNEIVEYMYQADIYNFNNSHNNDNLSFRRDKLVTQDNEIIYGVTDKVIHNLTEAINYFKADASNNLDLIVNSGNYTLKGALTKFHSSANFSEVDSLELNNILLSEEIITIDKSVKFNDLGGTNQNVCVWNINNVSLVDVESISVQRVGGHSNPYSQSINFDFDLDNPVGISVYGEVYPSNATHKGISWEISDPNVVQVDTSITQSGDYQGIIPIAPGTATITLRSISNPQIVASVFVTVIGTNTDTGYQYGNGIGTPDVPENQGD